MNSLNKEEIILKIKHNKTSIEFFDFENFNIIDEHGDVNSVKFSGISNNFELNKISENEIEVKQLSTEKIIANIFINSEHEEVVNFDINYVNGFKISNITMTAKGGGKWGAIGDFFGMIGDLFSGGSTELEEVVIYYMRDCYKNHLVAMQNCIGGSVSLNADQATGQCSIGNCVK